MEEQNPCAKDSCDQGMCEVGDKANGVSYGNDRVSRGNGARRLEGRVYTLGTLPRSEKGDTETKTAS